MVIGQHDTLGVSANKSDTLATNLCESIIAWIVTLSAEANYYWNYCFSNLYLFLFSAFYLLYICIRKFLVAMTRRNVAEST